MKFTQKNYEQLQIILYGTIRKELKVEYLHGYLSAVECSPFKILQREWISFLLIDKGALPEFCSEQEAGLVFDSIVELYDEIVLSFERHEFTPLYSIKEEEVTEGMMLIWCKGFILGTNLWKEFLLKDEKAVQFVTPIFLAGNNDQTLKLLKDVEDKDYSQEEVDEFKKNALNLIPELINHLWSHNHQKNQSIRRKRK